MIEIVKFALFAVTSIVAVMEPASPIAVYATLTNDMDSKKKRRTIARSMRISFLILVFFALTGHLLFQVFNITVAAFQIAGGILLVAVALEMLHPGKIDFRLMSVEILRSFLWPFLSLQVQAQSRQLYFWLLRHTTR